MSEEEKRSLATHLANAVGLKQKEVEEGGWFKVDFETVPELVESRRVFLKAGKAYVPVKEQMTMVLAGFNERLEKGLEVYNHGIRRPCYPLTCSPGRRPRLPPPRRRRSPHPHPQPPLQKFRNPRLHPLRRRQRPLLRNHKCHLNRLPLRPLPPLHAQPPHAAPQKLPPKTLRSPPIHPLPQRHRPLPRRLSHLLAPGFQINNRRHLQQRIPLQHPPRLRRRRRRRHPSRPRLLPFFLPKNPNRTPPRHWRIARVPLPPLQHRQPNHPPANHRRQRPRRIARGERRCREEKVSYSV